MNHDELRAPQVAAVVGKLPDDEWLTEADVADVLHRTYKVRIDGEGGFRVKGRGLAGILKDARRAGWLIRDQRTNPTVYQLTPSLREYLTSEAVNQRG